MEIDKIYDKNENMVWRKIADETILVPVHREMVDLESVYTLNETAAYIWSLIDGKRTVEQILREMVAEFDVEPKQVEKDLSVCLSQLLEIAGIKEASSGNI
ncbi:MAG: PqqD family protein [Thermoleophilia bacterium]